MFFLYFLVARGSIFLIDVHAHFCFLLLKRGGGHAASLRFGLIVLIKNGPKSIKSETRAKKTNKNDSKQFVYER